MKELVKCPLSPTYYVIVWLDYSAEQLAQERVHNRYRLWNELKCDGAGENCENLLRKIYFILISSIF